MSASINKRMKYTPRNCRRRVKMKEHHFPRCPWATLFEVPDQTQWFADKRQQHHLCYFVFSAQIEWVVVYQWKWNPGETRAGCYLAPGARWVIDWNDDKMNNSSLLGFRFQVLFLQLNSCLMFCNLQAHLIRSGVPQSLVILVCQPAAHILGAP